MTQSFENKVEAQKRNFSYLSTLEMKYNALIELGRQLPSYPPEQKTPEWIVKGCQSTLYLYAECKHGKIFFLAQSDALISAGLAALLLSVYSGETPELILKSPPTFLKEIGILSALSPNRSNGLAQIHLRMKQHAFKFLITK